MVVYYQIAGKQVGSHIVCSFPLTAYVVCVVPILSLLRSDPRSEVA